MSYPFKLDDKVKARYYDSTVDERMGTIKSFCEDGAIVEYPGAVPFERKIPMCNLFQWEQPEPAPYPRNAQIENNFMYHPVKPGQAEKYQDLRAHGKILAYAIEAHCPNSREKSLALTKLEEAIMWANASIARNE